MRRRTFIQLVSTAVAFVTSPLRVFSRPAPAPVAIAVSIPAPHRSCLYVYNPGLDIDGVEAYPFGRLKTNRGGCITRITEGEEWLGLEPIQYEHPQTGWWKTDKLKAGWRPIVNETRERAIQTGLYRTEVAKATQDQWGFYEPRYVVTHPAQEVLRDLRSQRDLLSRSLVHIKEWDDKPVDVDGVNRLLAGATIKERMRAVVALPFAAWRMTSVLRKRWVSFTHSNFTTTPFAGFPLSVNDTRCCSWGEQRCTSSGVKSS